MYFRKIPYIANFEFLEKVSARSDGRIGRIGIHVGIRRYSGDIFHIGVRSALWPRSYSQAGLSLPPAQACAEGGCVLDCGAGLGLTLRDAGGRTLLSSPPRQTFGVCGSQSLFVFDRTDDDQFYGMGEKLLGFELSGRQTKFWNTDAFADFYHLEVKCGRPDPLYVSVPYVIIKRGNTYVGLLLDNPHATFISTAGTVPDGRGRRRNVMLIGAEQGQPDLYIIVGPSLAELTRKLQRLVGLTPVPPVWALGYHQCRWGYKSAKDLENLDRQFRRYRIPCDGLWLDIDYMRDFRVFTFNRRHFPDPAHTFRRLLERGRRVIPIIDPGVKREPGYEVYDSGCRENIFCRNPQGAHYVGLVWPGETVFPDFSMSRARSWWARQVKTFAERGLYGCWIDMNDPSTGSSKVEDMLFNNGHDAHDTYHNQYALGMAQATRAGLQAAHPGERIFLISRSGFIGTSRYSAIWTGDNVSNYHYLRNAIPCSLNLALSGIPFNGPDIGGFADDTSPRLMVDWMKACFLFPFCRNHSSCGTRAQEPWAFGPRVMAVLRHYIRLRYKLRPYLYNLFVQQAEHGEAILRPLFYDFADTPSLLLGKIDDQFMVGPAVMQAPVVSENSTSRAVVLPDANWYSALDSRWHRGGRRVRVSAGMRQTPLYFREGTIVPMAMGEPGDNRYEGNRVECHVFLHRKGRERVAACRYVFDDGVTLDSRQGRRGALEIKALASRRDLDISTRMTETSGGSCKVRFVLYDEFETVRVNGKACRAKPAPWVCAGVRQEAARALPVILVRA